jgi:tetratricopeptide (TPR) repeat protein
MNSPATTVSKRKSCDDAFDVQQLNIFMTFSQSKGEVNIFFQEKKYDEAINIELDSTDFTFCHNRSTAFLNKGELESALNDAEMCIKLNPGFEKGYFQKAVLLQALKEYKEAVHVLEQGIAKFPESSSLREQLSKAKLALYYDSKMAHCARNCKAAIIATQSLKRKVENAENLTSFIRERKAFIELQIYSLKAQHTLLNDLSVMKDEEKLRFLFQLVDSDEDGKVNARELADILKRRNSELNFAESIERSVNYVATFDEDYDARLDFSEFASFLTSFAHSMGTQCQEVAEYLIIKCLFLGSPNCDAELYQQGLSLEKIDEAVAEKALFFDVVNDPRLVGLFSLFDKASESTSRN